MEDNNKVVDGNLKIAQHRKMYQFLLTSRLNQDCVENLFSVIGGHRENPDVSEFRASFRFIAVNKLFVPVSGSNCEMDCDSVLLDAASLSETLHVPKDQLSLNPDTGITCELQLVCEDDFDVDIDNVTMSPIFSFLLVHVS